MTDHWMPLAEDNPIPGDPWALLNLASTLAERGGVIETVLEDLNKIDATGSWQSPAAAALTEVRDEVLPNLKLLATRFEKTTCALRTYSEHLNTAQDKAECARLKAKAAELTITGAERNLATKAAQATTLPLDPAAIPVFTAPDPDQMALEDGRDQLSLARQILAEAEALRDDAAGQCARAIGDAIDDDLRNDDGGLWGGIKRFAKRAVDNFPYVDDIARVAGLASGVLGLLSLIPPLTPFLAPVAFAAGTISFLANSTLAAAGEQGWGPAIWDAVGLAAFGLGRVATAASRARAGQELATRADELNQIRRLAQGRIVPFKELTPLGTTRLHTTARHIRQTTSLFARSARPFVGAGGKPVGNWRMLRSAAAFWKHASVPSDAILDVAPRAARMAVGAHLTTAVGTAADINDIYSEPVIDDAIPQHLKPTNALPRVTPRFLP